eukprot:UN33756
MLKLQNEKTTMPSYVCFTENKTYYGWEAKALCKKFPEQTIFDVKRLIGKKFSDKDIQADLKHYPFTVKRLKEDDILIEVKVGSEVKSFLPEEISGLILKEIKRYAEKDLGCKVENAVITVPAYFNDAQRTATKRAGKLAGFNVQRIINEPTAAALAYGLDKKIETEQKVLVFDLGGGTFDVSLLCIDMGIFEVKSTSGNTHLGGEDFDSNLVNHCLKYFKSKNKINEDLDAKAMSILRASCEEAKIKLSRKLKTCIEIGKLYKNLDFKLEITRKEFEKMNRKLFQQCMLPVENCLQHANILTEEIGAVILIGGSTRIPGVRILLQDFFDGKELYTDIDPDEAVANGATVQGAIINLKGDKGRLKDVLVLDVLPLSIGIAIHGSIMDKVVSRNETIPHTCKSIFTTYEDDQESVLIKLYEGERAKVTDNRLLGGFVLEGIPKAPAGEPQIEICFVIDENGILTVTAKDLESGSSNSVTIRNTNCTDEELQQM